MLRNQSTSDSVRNMTHVFCHTSHDNAYKYMLTETANEVSHGPFGSATPAKQDMTHVQNRV